MQTIIKYRANDGTEFTSEAKCRERDELIVACRYAMAVLPEVDLKSEEFVQRDRDACYAAKRAIVDLVRKTIDPNRTYPAIHDMDADQINPRSFIGRLIDDSDVRPINHAWYRIMCINWENFREYSQPYFAAHPNEATKEV